MKSRITHIYGSLTPDALVAVWLAVWWVLNLIEAGCTELANDEAYYHLFALQPAWGYFDHPPMTALLVRLGGLVAGGELGVRLFFTLLQPLYLYVFWRLVRPAEATRRDAALYVVLSAATLILELYGFIAVPDGPLMMTAALFLWTFRNFAERRPLAWLWMGVAMAAMAYSKYHGALVVIFCLAANPRLLLRPGLYDAAVMLPVVEMFFTLMSVILTAPEAVVSTFSALIAVESKFESNVTFERSRLPAPPMFSTPLAASSFVISTPPRTALPLMLTLSFAVIFPSTEASPEIATVLPAVMLAALMEPVTATASDN